MHRLVVLNQVGPQPGPGYTVDHRNRKRSDNRVSNLRWATISEQSANRKKTDLPRVRSVQGQVVSDFDSVHDAARQLKEDNAAEKSKHASLIAGISKAIRLKKMYRRRRWVRIVSEPVGRVAKVPGFPFYHVSDCGMIQQRTGRWTYGKKYEESKYFEVPLLTHPHFVHNLVAEVYCPGKTDEMNTVCHVNGIFTDNRSENLQWMTRRSNNEHQIRIGVRSSREPCGVPVR